MPVVETHLFDVVKQIGPMLREAGKEGERERRLPKRAIDQLADAGGVEVEDRLPGDLGPAYGVERPLFALVT